MAQQAAHRHTIVGEFAFRQLPAREIGGDRRVEVELARLDECHDAPSGYPLAQGCDLEERVAIDRLTDRCCVFADGLASLDQYKDDVAATLRFQLANRSIGEGARIATRCQRTVPPSIENSDKHEGRPHDHTRDRADEKQPPASLSHVSPPRDLKSVPLARCARGMLLLFPSPLCGRLLGTLGFQKASLWNANAELTQLENCAHGIDAVPLPVPLHDVATGIRWDPVFR